jgi:hypothetical protein
VTARIRVHDALGRESWKEVPLPGDVEYLPEVLRENVRQALQASGDGDLLADTTARRERRERIQERLRGIPEGAVAQP